MKRNWREAANCFRFPPATCFGPLQRACVLVGEHQVQHLGPDVLDILSKILADLRQSLRLFKGPLIHKLVLRNIFSRHASRRMYPQSCCASSRSYWERRAARLAADISSFAVARPKLNPRSFSTDADET